MNLSHLGVRLGVEASFIEFDREDMVATQDSVCCNGIEKGLNTGGRTHRFLSLSTAVRDFCGDHFNKNS